MTNRTFIATLLLTLTLLPGLFADQITLKNGDRLTGAIVKSDGKDLVIKSELAGAVTVPWDAVVAFTSSKDLVLTLKDGQSLAGTVSAADGKVAVATKNAGQVTTSKDAIQTVRSQDEQAAYNAEIERLRNPRLLDLWSGFVDAGLSTTRGNVNTTNFNVGLNAARTTSRDKIAVYLTSLYSKSNASGAPLVTADAVRGGVAYNLNVSKRVFGFGFTDEEYDKFQQLDLRFVGGGGLGWHAVKSERSVFDLLAGGSFEKEVFTTLTRSAGEVLFGEEYNYKVAKTFALHEKFVVYPNVSSGGAFRMTFDTSAVTSLNKWLGWQVSLSDRYLSNPIPGVKSNDLLLTTGIRVTFANAK